MLKPEDAEKVLTKNLANVIRKANSGKSLTAAERALISQAATGGPVSDTGSAFAKTYDELAQRFGLTRKTLQNASHRFPEDVPRPRPDGRHDVAAWSEFIIRHNIARSAENISGAPAEENAGSPAQFRSVTDWKAEELRLRCERLEIENAKSAGQLVEVADVETGTAALVGGFNQALNNLVPRLAQKILGCTDYHEAGEIIQAEVDIVRRTLARCDFLKRLQGGTAASDGPLPSQEPPPGAPPAKKAAKAADVGKKPPGAKTLPTKTLPSEKTRRSACTSTARTESPKRNERGSAKERGASSGKASAAKRASSEKRGGKA